MKSSTFESALLISSMLTFVAACGAAKTSPSIGAATQVETHSYRVSFVNTDPTESGIACGDQIARVSGVQNLRRAAVFSAARTTVLDFEASLETARMVAALSCVGLVQNAVSNEPISAVSSGELSTYHVTFDITPQQGQAPCATQIAAIEGIQNLRDARVTGFHRATLVARDFEATAEVAAKVSALSCASVSAGSSES